MIGRAALTVSALGALFFERTDRRSQPKLRAPVAAPIVCAADSDFQRLAFSVGDWEVFDSTGAHHAVQRVRAVLDSCAITANWESKGGYKGLNVSAFDSQSHEWRQVYLSNQVFGPEGVTLRRSDPTYSGPGVRFVLLNDPGPSVRKRSRVTVLPLSGHRAMKLFEDSDDAGATWHVQFKAEHRRLKGGA